MDGWFEQYRQIMSMVGAAVDGLGVAVILGGALLALLRLAFVRRDTPLGLYQQFRHNLGRAILLGLEFLIAGDIIRTVVVDPTMLNVLILGAIVFIRTFLSIALQLEIDGRWPWQPAAPGQKTQGTPTDESRQRPSAKG